jgi:hypothetical protein
MDMHRPRFTLRTLAIVVTVVCIYISIWFATFIRALN